MTNRSAGRAGTYISARPTPSLYLLLGFAPSVALLLIFFLVPSDPRGRVSAIVVTLLILNVPMLIGGLRIRIRIYDEVLAVSELIGTYRVLLPELRSFSVRLRQIRRREFWEMQFVDAAGRRAKLSFTGFSARDRERILAALRPYVLAPGVDLSGPAEKAMAGELWQSFRHTPDYHGEHERH